MKWKFPVILLCASLVGAAAPMVAQAQQTRATAELNAVDGLEVQEREDGTYIRIRGSEVATFSVFKLDDPPRLFVDLSNSRVAAQGLSEEIHNGVITRVGLVEFEDGFQNVARLVIGFRESAHYDVRAEGPDVLVFVDGEGRHAQRPGMAQGDNEAARERALELEIQLSQTNQALDVLSTEKEEMQAQLAEMDSTVREAERQMADQRRQLEDAQNRAADLERRLEAARTNVSVGADNQALVRQLEAEREELQQLQRQRTAALRATQADVERTEQELASLQASLNERDGEISELRERLQESQRIRQELEEAQARAAQEARQARQQAVARESELRRFANQRQDDQEALRRQEEELREIAENASRPVRGQAARAVAVDPTRANAIRGVRLETREDGRSRVIVDLDRPGRFETATDNGRSVMIFNNVELPEELEKTLSADAEGGAVRFLSSYALENGTVRMEADLRAESSEVIRQEGSSVVWEFAPTVATGQGPLAGDARPRRLTDGDSVTSNPPPYPRVVTDPTQVTTVPGMGRSRLTIDLRNIDIENLLRLIASESGVNIIAGSDVSGTVTMRLSRVPLDQAFLTILQSLQLGFEMRGNVIRVAPQSTLLEELAARAEARARAQAVEPLEVFLLPINYASANDLTGQVEGLLSPRGSVTVDERTNTLIIKDLVANLSAIRLLVETLDAQVPQVLIEARIVETNDTFTRQIGIQWGGDMSFAQGRGNPTGLIFPNVLGLAGGATDGQTPTAGGSENPNFAVNLPAASGTGSGGAIGLTMGSIGGAVNLNLRLSALEDAGHAKIISSPRILTLDNQQATISQGTSIPISVVGAAGVQTVFVDATLELTVTPHVTPDGNVRLSIQATKNEPDFQNTGARGDPTIIQNQAQTELLIKDGDTTVIGGIYSQNSGYSVSAVPFLHRIPVLGFFFRTRSENENRSELLIFITPRIVNRAEALGVMSAGSLESGNGPMGE